MAESSAIINARKFDRSIHRSWKCELEFETESYWQFSGEFEKEVVHSRLGIIRRNTKSREYYFKNEWYNVFEFIEPTGEFRNFYCNISLPPTFDGTTLDFVDLDIDLLIWADGRIEILDQDEFEQNRILLSYPDEIILKTKETLGEILAMIHQNEFPFDSLAKPLNLSKI